MFLQKSDFDLWALISGLECLTDSGIGINNFRTLQTYHSNEKSFQRLVNSVPEGVRARLVAIVSDLATRCYNPGSLDSLRQQWTFRQENGISEGLHSFLHNNNIPSEASRAFQEDRIHDEYDITLLTSSSSFKGWWVSYF